MKVNKKEKIGEDLSNHHVI